MASAGGHITEALRLEESLGVHLDSLWVTFETPQTASLLHSRRVLFVPYVAPRDVRGALSAGRQIAQAVSRERFDACLSTGAAVAGFGVPWCALTGIPTFYVESLARIDGPSATGQLMGLAPRVRTLSQRAGWASKRWVYEGSLLDGWRVCHRAGETITRRIFVTLGTIRPYRFDRAIDTVLASLRPGDEVVWQLGATSRDRLPGRTYTEMSHADLAHELAAADVVVTHAGVGSVLQAHEAGKVPVLAVRSAAHGEHVDEHQREIAHDLTARGLALPLILGEPNGNTFDHARALQIIPTGDTARNGQTCP
ncbi:glycosyltransferase [Kocuria aegyptia]|uniref:Glycosyl transferase family 28 C-terminal domain-containing protein n=1 Tax=Kocuria aegyptia TaxID=330943 RepID=A0ABP4W3K8_9MICC